MCDSPGLVDFAVRVMDLILHLPDGQAKVFSDYFLGNSYPCFNITSVWASENYYRASTSRPQVARSWEIQFLCTLVNRILFYKILLTGNINSTG